jgi:hypothetical protein
VQRYQTFVADSHPSLAGVEVKIRRNAIGAYAAVILELWDVGADHLPRDLLATASETLGSLGTTFTEESLTLTYHGLVSGQEYALVLGQAGTASFNPAGYEWCTAEASAAGRFGKKTSYAWVDESGSGDGWLKVHVDDGTGANPQVADVYVAGWESTGTHTVAKYWKNGIAVPLPGGTASEGATSIFVSGTDVYVAGWGDNGTHSLSQYWKNGTPVQLSDGTYDARASSIVVSGGDVYVAGFDGYQNSDSTCQGAVYWKDGAAVPLNGSLWGKHSAEARSISVSGGDVHVVGGAEASAYDWKRGSDTENMALPGGTTATSVAVSAGGDVYAAGYAYSPALDTGQAYYWVNGSATPLSGDTSTSYASGIAVHDGHAYLAGSLDGAPMWWIDGADQGLTDGTIAGGAEAITVAGNTTYLAGWESVTAHTQAVYWRARQLVPLSDGSHAAEATAIAVVLRSP